MKWNQLKLCFVTMQSENCNVTFAAVDTYSKVLSGSSDLQVREVALPRNVCDKPQNNNWVEWVDDNPVVLAESSWR